MTYNFSIPNSITRLGGNLYALGTLQLDHSTNTNNSLLVLHGYTYSTLEFTNDFAGLTGTINAGAGGGLSIGSPQQNLPITLSTTASGPTPGAYAKVDPNSGFTIFNGDNSQSVTIVASSAGPTSLMSIGSAFPDPSATLDLQSVNGGLLLPRVTTVQRNAINSGTFATGLEVYNTDTNLLQVWNGSTWLTLLPNLVSANSTPASIAATGNTNSQRSGASLLTLANRTVALAIGGGGSSNTSETYSPATTVWTNTGSMSSFRDWSGQSPNAKHATVLDGGSNVGKVIVFGGNSSGTDVEFFDYTLGTWSSSAATLYAGRQTTWVAPFADGTGRVLIGYDIYTSFDVNSVQYYSPATDSVSSAATGWGASGTPLSDYELTNLPDGTILLTGGWQGQGVLPMGSTLSTEIFSPSTLSWTQPAPLANVQRAKHTATLLTDGTVLLAGGYDANQGTPGNPVAVNSAEIYNPVTHTYTALANTMTEARINHTAILLPNGKVWIHGGSTDATSEIYDPVAQTFTADVTGTLYSEAPITMLFNSDVLISGGTGGAGPDTSELYVPVAQVLLDFNTLLRQWLENHNL